MRLVVVVGNPKPRSRTLAVAELLAGRVAGLHQPVGVEDEGVARCEGNPDVP